MKLVDQTAIAQWAVASLPQRVRAKGKFTARDSDANGAWRLEESGFDLVLSDCVWGAGIMQRPALNIEVVRNKDGVKVLSVSWLPELPKLPPVIRTMTEGRALDEFRLLF
ncbi:hypothetical protein [Pseudorhodoferax soli]|uniref:Uncharacterized protein n=1 Tax=Pseudorhodoferax soli TaxID=545864 RepID=A0A368XL03_9BURK|nr:hypothetical protein [Pseudorhodoferax soli]RCW68580.1 hypothetical protein DES41_107101 [Pseudorhodoferax soli]